MAHILPCGNNDDWAGVAISKQHTKSILCCLVRGLQAAAVCFLFLISLYLGIPTSASLLISSVGRASGRRTDGWHRRGGFPSADGGVGVTFGMFGGLMKRDPQQMARVPLFIITIVRHHIIVRHCLC